MTMRKPSDRTYQQEHRIELSNLLIVLICLGLLPIFSYLILNNALLVLGIEFMFLVGFMDLVLTADMLNRGYREQNFYRLLFSHLGNKQGFRVTILLNFAFRAGLIALFIHEPSLILMCALSSFFGPLWNSLHGFTFRDDIVLQLPTHVTISNISANEIQMEVDAGNKIRLEQKKEGLDSS